MSTGDSVKHQRSVGPYGASRSGFAPPNRSADCRSEQTDLVHIEIEGPWQVWVDWYLDSQNGVPWLSEVTFSGLKASQISPIYAIILFRIRMGKPNGQKGQDKVFDGFKINFAPLRRQGERLHQLCGDQSLAVVSNH